MKLGALTLGVAAGLVAFAPLASAQDDGSNLECEGGTDDRGNTGLVNECNVFGQNNGQNNTLNGEPFPDVLPDVPVQDEDPSLVNAQ